MSLFFKVVVDGVCTLGYHWIILLLLLCILLHNHLQLHLIFTEVYKISSIQNKHENIHVSCIICALESQILVLHHFINPQIAFCGFTCLWPSNLFINIPIMASRGWQKDNHPWSTNWELHACSHCFSLWHLVIYSYFQLLPSYSKNWCIQLKSFSRAALEHSNAAKWECLPGEQMKAPRFKNEIMLWKERDLHKFGMTGIFIPLYSFCLGSFLISSLKQLIRNLHSSYNLEDPDCFRKSTATGSWVQRRRKSHLFEEKIWCT